MSFITVFTITRHIIYNNFILNNHLNACAIIHGVNLFKYLRNRHWFYSSAETRKTSPLKLYFFFPISLLEMEHCIGCLRLLFKQLNQALSMYRAVYLNNRLHKTDNIDALYRKGQGRLFKRRPRSFNVYSI